MEEKFSNETLANIKPIHTTCAGERKKTWQKKHMNTPIKIGDQVKFALEGKEHIWAQIMGVDGDKLTGRLTNVPLARDHSLGDEITIKRTDIEDCMRKSGVD